MPDTPDRPTDDRRADSGELPFPRDHRRAQIAAAVEEAAARAIPLPKLTDDEKSILAALDRFEKHLTEFEFSIRSRPHFDASFSAIKGAGTITIPIEEHAAYRIALAPFATIAFMYRNPPVGMNPDQVVIYAYGNDEGRAQLTLADCYAARDALGGKFDALAVYANRDRVLAKFPPDVRDGPADPVKRWPFAESPGDFAKRLFTTYKDAYSIPAEAAMLSAVRHVLIEQPPRLAPWLDPGAAAKDSARLNLIEVALRHAFGRFRSGAIEITPEEIMTLGSSVDDIRSAIRSALHFQGDEFVTPEAILKLGKAYAAFGSSSDPVMPYPPTKEMIAAFQHAALNCVDGGSHVPWNIVTDGYAAMRIKAPRAGSHGNDHVSVDVSTIVERDRARKLRDLLAEVQAIYDTGEIATILVPEPLILRIATALAEWDAGAETTKPKQNRASDAQKVVAKAALKNVLKETFVDYDRIANAVADAVVGAEQ